MFTEATDTVLMGKPGLSEEENQQAQVAAGFEMFGYFHKMVQERRENPGDDITSTLIHTEVELEDGKRLLTDEELYRMFFLLLIAGLHTTQGALAWSIIHLSKNPEQRQALLDDDALLPSTVEEILRFEAPVTPPAGARPATSNSVVCRSRRVTSSS